MKTHGAWLGRKFASDEIFETFIKDLCYFCLCELENDFGQKILKFNFFVQKGQIFCVQVCKQKLGRIFLRTYLQNV